MSEEITFEKYSNVFKILLLRKAAYAYRSSRQARRRRRRTKERSKFSESAFNRLSPRQFTRYFRMSRQCFFKLCDVIRERVGENVFKSESHLDNLSSGVVGTPHERQMHHAQKQVSGGFICGEIKVALSLRMISGGSYLDLSLLFDISCTSSYDIFHNVVANWFNHESISKLSGREFLNSLDRMAKVASEFAVKSSGKFTGCIGALDGWLVRINKPTEADGVDNPGDYFSRKGFYCVNVQVIVDRNKKVLYRSIRSRGAEHDSTAFRNSSIYDELLKRSHYLNDRKLYFIGDSAYALRSFMITPYDNTYHGEAKDNFNYFHSSSRIAVECTFGEICARFGVLW
jgi:hypothetical protein